jgi:hypothetical protein
MKLFATALGLVGLGVLVSERALPGDAGFQLWIPITLAICIVSAMACMSLAMIRMKLAVALRETR